MKESHVDEDDTGLEIGTWWAASIDFIEEEMGELGRRDVRNRHTAIGVNFINTMQRRGSVAVGMPSGLGHEAAGIIETSGSPLHGDPVCYMMQALEPMRPRQDVAADRLVLGSAPATSRSG